MIQYSKKRFPHIVVRVGVRTYGRYLCRDEQIVWVKFSMRSVRVVLEAQRSDPFTNVLLPWSPLQARYDSDVALRQALRDRL